MSLSPDRTRVVTAGIDGMIRIWDLSNGKMLRVMVGHASDVSSVAWSPDGRLIASGGYGDSRIRVWNAANGMPLRVFRCPAGYVAYVAWSPVGSELLATGGTSGWVWLWNLANDEERTVVETGQEVRSFDIAPNGEQAAISNMEGAVSIVDLAAGKVIHSLGDPMTPHHCVRWSPDGSRLAVGSESQSVVYEMPSGKALDTYTGTTVSLAWSPDGKQLCTVSGGGRGRIWGAATRKRPKAFDLGGRDLLWPRENQIIALDDTAITATKVDSEKQEFQYTLSRTAPPLWTAGKPIVTGLGTTKLALWDRLTAQAIHTLDAHTERIHDVAWNRDGKLLASSSADKTVCLWEAASGKLIEKLKEHTEPVEAVAWSADGKILASAGRDRVVRLWQPSGKSIGTLEGHAATINALAWAGPNQLASGDANGSIRVWSVNRRQASVTIEAGKSIETLAFTIDGSVLAGGMSEGFVQLWYPGNGRPIPKTNLDQKRTSGGVNALSWSPDGRKMLVACHSRRSIDLWDLQSSELQRLGTGVRGRYVAWSANGSLLVGGTADSVVQFWDKANLELRGFIFDQSDHIVILSPNGNYRIDSSHRPEFVYVVQTDKEQLLLEAGEFEAKYNWKNAPAQVMFAK
jgi:WD40 repeat protein